MRFILTIISCTIIASATFCQPIKKQIKPETAALVKSRKLVVLLRSEDDKITKKLAAAEQKKYKENIRDLNANLQFVIKTFWTFNTSIDYLTKEAISTLKDPDQYAVVALDLINVKFNNQLTRAPVKQILRFHICQLEEYDALKPIFYQDIIGLISEQDVPTVSKMDLIAAMHMVQNHLEGRFEGKPRRNGMFYDEAIEHAGTLQNKTLLIDTTFMDDNLKEADIKASYTYPFMISNQQAIEKAQISKDKRYAYVYLFPIPDAANIYYHCILDCETGKSISYSVQSGFHMNNLIDTKHLEQYVLYSDYYNNKKKKKGK